MVWCEVFDARSADCVIIYHYKAFYALRCFYMNRVGRILSASLIYGLGSGPIPDFQNDRTCVCGFQLWNHWRAGSVLVYEWRIMLYSYVASIRENFKSDGARRAWTRKAREAFIIVRLSL